MGHAVTPAMEEFYRLAFGRKSGDHMVAIYRLLLKRWREDYIPKFEKGPLFRQSMVFVPMILAGASKFIFGS